MKVFIIQTERILNPNHFVYSFHLLFHKYWHAHLIFLHMHFFIWAYSPWTHPLQVIKAWIRPFVNYSNSTVTNFPVESIFFESRLNVHMQLSHQVFFVILLQIQMHCLPIQAKADHIHSYLDNSHYLGSGHIHYVSLGGDVTSDQGANHSGATGLWQQNKPVLLVQRELAKPGDEEDLHHCPVCQYLPCSSFTHRDHVRSDWHYAFQNNSPNGRKAGPRQPPYCVKEKAESY